MRKLYRSSLSIGIFLIFLLKFNASCQNNINTNLFGQNAWFIDVNNPDNLDSYWTQIEESGVTSITSKLGLEYSFNGGNKSRG